MGIDVAEIRLQDGFTSKELDTKTSLYYFGARYYDPWRGQLNTIDPHAGLYAWSSPYSYAGDNPVSFLDRTGMDSTNSQQQTSTEQLPPQGPVTLVGPEEVQLAPHGFAVTPTNPTSRILSSLSDFLDKASDMSGAGAAVFMVGGFATGTEEVAAPISVGLATISYYSEATSVGLKTFNYITYHQGSETDIVNGIVKVGTESVFNVIANELSRAITFSGTQEGEKEALRFALTALFMTARNNINSNAYSRGPVYVYPDATSH